MLAYCVRGFAQISHFDPHEHVMCSLVQYLQLQNSQLCVTLLKVAFFFFSYNAAKKICMQRTLTIKAALVLSTAAMAAIWGPKRKGDSPPKKTDPQLFYV